MNYRSLIGVYRENSARGRKKRRRVKVVGHYSARGWVRREQHARDDAYLHAVTLREYVNSRIQEADPDTTPHLHFCRFYVINRDETRKGYRLRECVNT